MAATASKRWMKLAYARIPEQVGTFFEQITRQLTRGVSDAKPQIDMQAWSIDSGIEVKGGDNTHSFRIPVDQLARHSDLAEFPFSRVLYFLYRYDNRLSHNGPTGLSRARGPRQRSLYLFRRMMDLTVLDHRLLVALAGGKYSVRAGLLPMDPERRCINLKTRDLYRLFSTAWTDELAKIGVDPHDWTMVQRAIHLELNDGMEVYKNTFTIRSLLFGDVPSERLFKKFKRMTVRLPDLEL